MVFTNSRSVYGLLTCLFVMNLGDSVSKYWIYKWVYVSNLQTCRISSDFAQTVPSTKQASCMRGRRALVMTGPCRVACSRAQQDTWRKPGGPPHVLESL